MWCRWSWPSLHWHRQHLSLQQLVEWLASFRSSLSVRLPLCLSLETLIGSSQRSFSSFRKLKSFTVALHCMSGIVTVLVLYVIFVIAAFINSCLMPSCNDPYILWVFVTFLILFDSKALSEDSDVYYSAFWLHLSWFSFSHNRHSSLLLSCTNQSRLNVFFIIASQLGDNLLHLASITAYSWSPLIFKNCCIACQYYNTNITTWTEQSEWCSAAPVCWPEADSVHSYAQDNAGNEVFNQRTAQPVSLSCYC